VRSGSRKKKAKNAVLTLKTPPPKVTIKKEPGAKSVSTALSALEAKGFKIVGSKKGPVTEIDYYLKGNVITLIDPKTGRMPEGVSKGTSVLIGSSCSANQYEPCHVRAKELGHFNGGSNWCEKVLVDGAYLEDHFLAPLELKPIKKTMLNNIPYKNTEGYPVRLVEGQISTEGLNELEQLEAYGLFMQAVADLMNKDFSKKKGTKSIVHFDPKRDLSVATFQEFLGDYEAEKRLEGFGSIGEDFYEKHQAFVHACFTKGNLPRSVASRIGAPVSEVNSVEREEIIKEQNAQEEAELAQE